MNHKTTFQLICLITFGMAFGVGCQKADKTAEFREKRSKAVANAQPKTVKTSRTPEIQEDQEDENSVADATQDLVAELKAKQEAEEARELELDKARKEKEAKDLEALVKEVIYKNNDDPESWSAKRVPDSSVWIDRDNREVIVPGKVCLKEGPLEMFVSPMGQKTHETVVTVDAWASEVHIGIAICGAMPGSPVEFEPAYTPAHGPEVEIEVVWKEGDKVVRRRAQDMIRNAETQKVMDTHWVFGGSLAVEGEGYYGDGGALVCLSNFTVATLDIPIKSDAADAYLLYEANPENIPEVNTQVLVYFKPKLKDNEVADEADIVKEVQRINGSLPNSNK